MARPEPEPRADGAERVLVLVRGDRDAELTVTLLRRGAIEACRCENVADLGAKLRQGAAAAVLEEELLSRESLDVLERTLRQQPPWSDFPIIVFSAIGAGSNREADNLARKLGNVTFLDRPIRTRSMLASVRAAIRSRRRQYRLGTPSSRATSSSRCSATSFEIPSARSSSRSPYWKAGRTRANGRGSFRSSLVRPST